MSSRCALLIIFVHTHCTYMYMCSLVVTDFGEDSLTGPTEVCPTECATPVLVTVIGCCSPEGRPKTTGGTCTPAMPPETPRVDGIPAANIVPVAELRKYWMLCGACIAAVLATEIEGEEEEEGEEEDMVGKEDEVVVVEWRVTTALGLEEMAGEMVRVLFSVTII